MPPGARRQRPSSDDASAAALTGGGPSQLGVNGSMRARDVSRPTHEMLIDAERLVQVSYRPRSRPVTRPEPAAADPTARTPSADRSA